MIKGAGTDIMDQDMREVERLVEKLERAMRLYYSNAYTSELRPAQWQALRFFATAPSDRSTLSDFAHARASTIGTTSVTVSNLVERGFLERSRKHRNVGVRITEKGLNYLEQSDPARRLARVIEGLPAEQLQAMDDALSQIIEGLDKGSDSERRSIR